MQKSFGGHGLRQVQSSYESRIIAVRKHLIKNLYRIGIHLWKRNKWHIKSRSRITKKYNNLSNPNEPPKSASRKFKKADQTSKRDNFVQKPLHGYFYKQINKGDNIDKQQSLA